MAPFCPFFHNCNIAPVYLHSETSLICLIYFTLEYCANGDEWIIYPGVSACCNEYLLVMVRIKIFLSCFCFFSSAFSFALCRWLALDRTSTLPSWRPCSLQDSSFPRRGFSLGYKWGGNFLHFLSFRVEYLRDCLHYILSIEQEHFRL